VDAVFSERASFEYQLAKQPRQAESVRWQAPPLEIKPTFMAIAKQHPQAEAWLELLNQEIRAAIKN
jgi:predicted NBD/HSP70 family sugar kinase